MYMESLDRAKTKLYEEQALAMRIVKAGLNLDYNNRTLSEIKFEHYQDTLKRLDRLSQSYGKGSFIIHEWGSRNPIFNAFRAELRLF